MSTQRLVVFSSLLAVVFLFSQCNKEELPIDNIDDFELYLQDEMEAQHISALSVLLFNGDEVLYERNLGLANIAAQRALTGNDLFLLASVSKVITATALLRLYDQGNFSLDDPINNYLPFNVNIPNETTAITFRHLLTHSSAIGDGAALDGQYYYGEDSPVALKSFLEDYLVPGGAFYDAVDNFHAFEPGTDYEYSNVGTALIAVLVEEISGKGFQQYCQDEIFQPLGMNRSYWSLEAAQQANQSLVQPYDYIGNSQNEIQHYTFTDYPNGGLRATARDLYQWMRTIAKGGQLNGYQLLEQATVEAMRQPQLPGIDPSVGLHFFLLDASNNLWGHDGGEQGVATIMAFNPERQVGAILLCNQGEADLDEMLVKAYEMALQL